MKALFEMTAIVALAAVSVLSTADLADARGFGGAGPRIMSGPRITPRITPSYTRIGPRVTRPRVSPTRIPRQFPRRPITGPRESGRGVGCQYVETSRRPIVHINPRTGASETTWISTGHTRCRLRI